KTASTILVFDKDRKRRECDEKVEIIRWPPVQRTAFPKAGDLVCVFAQRRAQRLLGILPSKFYDARIDIVCQFFQCGTADLPAASAMVTEQNRKTPDHQPNFFVVEEGTRSRTKRRNALRLKRIYI